MKTKTAVRAITVGFALTMFTSYVLYSQLTQNRQITPGSKAASIEAGRAKPPNDHPSKQTNTDWSEIIASSSKSKAPLIKVPAGLFQTSHGTNNPALVPELSSATPTFGSSKTNVIPPVVRRP